MVRTIVQLGNELLRQQSMVMTDLTSPETARLKQDLLDTLRDQPAGVAISAIQIGVPVQLYVVEIKPTPNRKNIEPVGPLFIFNPRVVKLSNEKVPMFEACLSIMQATLFGEVARPTTIDLAWTDEEGVDQEGKFDKFLGRVMQHELDHLEGKLFTDIVDPRTLMDAAEYRKFISKQK